MRSNRPRNTTPELAIRRELHARGLRFRIHRAPAADVRSQADILFPRARVAVYVDGCFWHSCPAHATLPKRNREFWQDKLDRNRERDRRTEAALSERGWTVLRIWEHERPTEAVDRIEAVLRGRPRIAGSAGDRALPAR